MKDGPEKSVGPEDVVQAKELADSQQGTPHKPEESPRPVENQEGVQALPSEITTPQARTVQENGDSDAVSPDAIGQAVFLALKEERSFADVSEIKELLRQVVENTHTPPPAPPTLVPSYEKVVEMRESFRQAALDAYREEYKELSEVWKGIELKAQGTITIAGIFIAAAFTFAKDLTTNQRLDFYGNLLLGAAIVCLIISIIFSVLALKTREVYLPPGGERIKNMADHYKAVIDEDLPDRKRRFINQHTSAWQEVVDDAREAVDDKERWVRTAQGFLVVAIIIAATLTLGLLKV
jgi:hypothetical protein